LEEKEKRGRSKERKNRGRLLRKKERLTLGKIIEKQHLHSLLPYLEEKN